MLPSGSVAGGCQLLEGDVDRTPQVGRHGLAVAGCLGGDDELLVAVDHGHLVDRHVVHCGDDAEAAALDHLEVGERLGAEGVASLRFALLHQDELTVAEGDRERRSDVERVERGLHGLVVGRSLLLDEGERSGEQVRLVGLQAEQIADLFVEVRRRVDSAVGGEDAQGGVARERLRSGDGRHWVAFLVGVDRHFLVCKHREYTSDNYIIAQKHINSNTYPCEKQ